MQELGSPRFLFSPHMLARLPYPLDTVSIETAIGRNNRQVFLQSLRDEEAIRCLELLGNRDERKRVAAKAWEMVNANLPWERVARYFEEILAAGPRMD